MKCPNCGAQSDGAFCSECGAPLKGAMCRECQASLVAGASFCNNCGTATGRRRARGASTNMLPWMLAGASVLVLLVVLALPALRNNEEPRADDRVPIDQVAEVAGGSTSGTPPPLTGTPREQADRLFNRVMTEKESGDTAQARFFVPMAVQAYERAGDLDADAHYHVSLLHSIGENHEASLASAERILSTSPNHLLALSAAAQSARASADTATARRYYQRFVSAYDAEIKTAKPEYQDHGKSLPELYAQALNYINRPNKPTQ